jgi:hypothetical protein
LSGYNGFIDNVERYERGIKNSFQNKIDKDTNTDINKFGQDIRKLVTKYDNDEYEEYNYNEDLEGKGNG